MTSQYFFEKMSFYIKYIGKNLSAPILLATYCISKKNICMSTANPLEKCAEP